MLIKIDIEEACQNLKKVDTAIEHKQPTSFWVQCVRDASGKWSKYSGKTSRYGVKYFRGHQPMVNYSLPEEVLYLKNSLATRRAFYAQLHNVKSLHVNDFRRWLEEFRRCLEYRPTEEWLHQRFATHAHTIIVREEVFKIASKYDDGYTAKSLGGPRFSNFPHDALPYDERDDDQIVHHYPALDFKDYYLSSALDELKALLTERLSKDEYIAKTAHFYQLLINLHYFAAMNASLYMNLTNGLLEIAGIKGIENGIIDFVALRLQPSTFQKYFYDEVIDNQ